MLTFGIATDPGIKRRGQPNQDHALVVLPNLLHRHPPLLVLADGMGGYQGGALASRLAVKAAAGAFRKLAGHGVPQALNACVAAAHQRIKKESAGKEQLNSMGTTLVAVAILNDQASVINVGDSRAYLFRGEQVQQLSEDQSMVAELVRQGALSPREARVHPKRNVLTQSINARRETLAPFTTATDLQDGDVILLCSDGLWGVLTDDVISGVARSFPPAEAAQRLVKLANYEGGPDNISVVIARMGAFTPPTSFAPMDDTEP